MAKHALWRKNNQRLADTAAIEAAVHLPAQQMEILRGRAGVDHLQVFLGAQNEETLDARTRMFGPLALVAMRQQQHQSAGLAPLRFGAGDELVNQDLRAVDKIAELRLPQHQGQRIGHAIAKFKTHYRVFAERAVKNIEARLIW